MKLSKKWHIAIVRNLKFLTWEFHFNLIKFMLDCKKNFLFHFPQISCRNLQILFKFGMSTFSSWWRPIAKMQVLIGPSTNKLFFPRKPYFFMYSSASFFSIYIDSNSSQFFSKRSSVVEYTTLFQLDIKISKSSHVQNISCNLPIRSFQYAKHIKDLLSSEKYFLCHSLTPIPYLT